MSRHRRANLVPVMVGALLLLSITSSWSQQFGLFRYTIVGSEVHIIDYPTDAEGTVEIPAEIDGLPVTRIAGLAFRSCGQITSVVIPPGVTHIENRAFRYCSKLKSVTLPPSLKVVEEYTFADCVALEAVHLPQGLETLGDRVFHNCASLKTVSFPPDVANIGDFVFASCTALESSPFPPDVIEIPAGSFTGCESLTDPRIGSGVTSIGARAFSECAMESLALPASVTSIGSYAFSSCQALQSITFPPGITEIAPSLVQACPLLEDVEIPAGVGTIGAQAFSNCTGLKTISLPNSVSSIGKGAFENCRSLAEIPLPVAVTRIEAETFAGCSGLTSISLPPNLTEIGDQAFRFCAGLTSIAIPDPVSVIGLRAFQGCRLLETVALPSSLLDLQESTFQDCPALTAIAIPPGVTSIGARCFFNCYELAEVRLGSGLLTIGVNAFYSCTSLATITIPASVTSIDSGVFSWCSALLAIEVEAGNAVYRSAGGALLGNAGSLLVKVPEALAGAYLLPAEVAEIDRWAFENCQFLHDIFVDPANVHYRDADGVLFTADGAELVRFPPAQGTTYQIPDGVVELGAYSFSECNQLATVIAPTSLAEIGQWAFSHCRDITVLAFRGDAPTLRLSGGLTPFSLYVDKLRIFRLGSASGFEDAAWAGLPIITIDEDAHPAARWLMDHGYSPFENLSGRPAPHGPSLLAAYAFGLEPGQRPPPPLVEFRLDPGTLGLSYVGARPGVSLQPEWSGDLHTWSSSGVTVDELGGRTTATVPRNGGERFLRLNASYEGPGVAVLLPGETLLTTFESSATSANFGYGSGVSDTLAWTAGGAGVVVEEAAAPNAPGDAGKALVLNSRNGNPPEFADFTTEAIDISAVSARDLIASVSVRTFDDSFSSNFEAEDQLEAWLEGSVDGLHFSRLASGTIIPLRTGDLSLRFNDPPSPDADDLKKLELPNGAYTTFSLGPDLALPREVRFVRIRIVASASSDSEWIFIDFVTILALDGEE